MKLANDRKVASKIVISDVNFSSSHWDHNDIIHRIGADWQNVIIIYGSPHPRNACVDGRIDITIPNFVRANRPLSELFDAYKKGIELTSKNDSPPPYFVLDFKEVQINVSEYVIKHPESWEWRQYEIDGNVQTRFTYCGRDGYMVNWVLEASNDLINWHSLGTGTNEHYCAARRVKLHGKRDYFTKFRLRMTSPNSDGAKRMKIKSFELYGTVRRTVFATRQRDEHIPIESFPKIPTRKCIGDIGHVFKILNESLQHDELQEYNEPINNLQVELKDYQKKGVKWMIDIEDNGNENGVHGGLLCDEMGLGMSCDVIYNIYKHTYKHTGKTVQMIALMLAQKQRKQTKDRTVIITPLSLIDQWMSEIKKIAGPNTFKYINYYGAGRNKITRTDFENCDIVFSTTRTFAKVMGKVCKYYDHFEKGYWLKAIGQQLIFKLERGFFSRIIVDESHDIKNTTSDTSTTLCSFAQRCHAKWCLTGTPVKNDLPYDLSGMMRFLGIKRKDYINAMKLSLNEINSNFAQPLEFHAWLDYDSNFCKKKIENHLRKYMLRRTKKQVLNEDFSEKEEIVIKCKLNDEERVIYDKNAVEAKQQYQRFKAEHNVMSNYFYLLRMLTKLRQICDHPSLVFNRFNQQQNDENNMNLSNVMDLESNIDALQRVGEAIVNRLNEMKSLIDYECPVCFESTELKGILLSNCGHMFCNECVHDLENKCAICRAPFTKRNMFKVSHVLKSEKIKKDHRDEFEEYQNENTNQQSNTMSNDQFANYEKFVKKYSNSSLASSKMNALIDRLEYIFVNHTGDKILVFSNFTGTFGLISNKLNEHNIEHLQYIGSMARKKRKKILDTFKSSNRCKVLLVSTKCASVGLNITCANHVIFFEPRCDPGLDNQAIGRCWRIGQMKTVYVTRLILEDTVEETILKLLSKKDDEDSDMVNLKQQTKLKESDYDIIFGYDEDENENETS